MQRKKNQEEGKSGDVRPACRPAVECVLGVEVRLRRGKLAIAGWSSKWESAREDRAVRSRVQLARDCSEGWFNVTGGH